MSIEEVVTYVKEAVVQVAEEMLEENQSFLFDEYFSDEKDRGIEVQIAWKGRNLPFRIKRSLTLKEKQRANDAAIKIELDKNGKPRLTSQDQSAFTTEVLLVGLKFWPFEYHAGKPVPINRETVSKMDSGLAEEIAARILGAIEVDEKALDPFEKKSDAA